MPASAVFIFIITPVSSSSPSNPDSQTTEAYVPLRSEVCKSEKSFVASASHDRVRCAMMHHLKPQTLRDKRLNLRRALYEETAVYRNDRERPCENGNLGNGLLQKSRQGEEDPLTTDESATEPANTIGYTEVRILSSTSLRANGAVLPKCSLLDRGGVTPWRLKIWSRA
ncbi:uncharacterized protein RAG0_12698 [Rhynchosporium agropyri]|uniref:Uncharacterized protein n=1 Tax=Rhynchosporium agropyri TaxID=914238 RepID=A0A1E1L9H7_9HELO|nr:uncharacterized protein RAG0_12698 [Rhynchosporium agropyri]